MGDASIERKCDQASSSGPPKSPNCAGSASPKALYALQAEGPHRRELAKGTQGPPESMRRWSGVSVGSSAGLRFLANSSPNSARERSSYFSSFPSEGSAILRRDLNSRPNSDEIELQFRNGKFIATLPSQPRPNQPEPLRRCVQTS